MNITSHITSHSASVPGDPDTVTQLRPGLSPAVKTQNRLIGNGGFALHPEDVFMPHLGRHVSCGGRGVPAALMLADRRYPLLWDASLRCAYYARAPGKRAPLGCELHIFGRAPALWAVTSGGELQTEWVQEQHAAMKLECAREGWTFHVFNACELMESMELRNVLLMRPYALVEVSYAQLTSVLNAFRERSEMSLRELVETVWQRDTGLNQIRGLLYRGLLEIDWTTLPISGSTQVRLRTSRDEES